MAAITVAGFPYWLTSSSTESEWSDWPGWICGILTKELMAKLPGLKRLLEIV